MPILTSAHRLKQLARKGERPTDLTLRKQLVSSIGVLDGRALRFAISTASVDRENDVVFLDGWDLDAFRRNPVVLWAHDQHCLPIGKAFDLDIEGDALKASVEFVAAETPEVGPRAEAVLQLCRNGFLSATSVGFRPLEYDIATSRDDGEGWFPPMNFLRQELLEFSIVTVPANAEALIELPDELTPASPQALAPDHDAEAERAAADQAARLVAATSRARRQRAVQVLGLS